MPDQDPALAKARVIVACGYDLSGSCKAALTRRIAKALREERTRAMANEVDADRVPELLQKLEAAEERAKRAIQSATNAANTAELLADELDAEKKRAAALELIVLEALGDKRCGRCSLEYPVWRCWRCIAESALRDHSGSLAAHDAEVRKAALLDITKLRDHLRDQVSRDNPEVYGRIGKVEPGYLEALDDVRCELDELIEGRMLVGKPGA